MLWKLFSSIILVVSVLDQVKSTGVSDQWRKREILPPGMSPQASMSPDDLQSPEPAPIKPSRPIVGSPGMSPQPSMPSINHQPPQSTVSKHSRPNVGSPGMSPQPSMPSNNLQSPEPAPIIPPRPVARVPASRPRLSIPSTQVTPTQPPDVLPLTENIDNPQAEPFENINPDQPPAQTPISNNPQLPAQNFNRAPPQQQRQQPVQNVKPSWTGNSDVRDNGFSNNFPSSTVPAMTNSNPQGSDSFGGSSWPSFFRKPHVSTNNAAGSNVPLQNSQNDGQQSSQTSPSIDRLMNQLSNLNNLFGNNQQDGNNAMGR